MLTVFPTTLDTANSILLIILGKVNNFLRRFILLKGPVRIILSDSPCNDGNVQLTMVPLKALNDQERVRYPC